MEDDDDAIIAIAILSQLHVAETRNKPVTDPASVGSLIRVPNS